MSITNVQRTFEGEYSDANGATLFYLVDTNSLSHESWTIQGATDGTHSIPGYGVNISGTPWYLVNKIARRNPLNERPFLWKVECQFSVPTATQIGPTGEKWAVDISVRGLPYEENVHVDKDGKPIQVFSTAEAYADPVVKTYYDEEITISYTTDTVDWNNIAALRGTINTNAVTLNLDTYARTWNAKSTKLTDASYSRFVGADGNHYWRINLTFVWRKDTSLTVINSTTVYPWTKLLPNAGFKFKNGAGAVVNAKDEHDQDITTPIYLDSSGHKQAVGAAVVFNGFNIDDFGDFTTLPVPNTGI